MDEPESNQNKGNANNAGEDDSIQAPSKGGGNSEITKTNKNKSNNKQEVDWPNWIQAIAMVFMVIITAFYTYYAREQADQMRNTVKVANDSYVAGEKSLTSTLTEMGKQSIAMQEAANANKKMVELADRRIKATQDQFRLEQRAWIKIKSVEFEEPLQAGKNGSIKFTLNNTGKTPALRVVYNYKIWEEVDGKSIIKIEGTDSKEFYYGPGDERYIIIITNEAMLQSEIDGIHDGKAKFFININFMYFDIYETKKVRHSRTCYQYMPVFKKFVFGNRCSYMD